MAEMPDEQRIPTLEELKRQRPPVRDVNAEHARELAPMERLAVWITDHVGTMGFFLLIFAWTLLWLGFNTLGPRQYRFDPFPAFVLWLFISNMLQIFLMPLILVGQNLEERHADRRAQSDYEVNVKAEGETEVILMHLERQEQLLAEIRDLLRQRGG